MLEELQKKNPQLLLYGVDSPEFASFGRIIDLDTKEILSAAATLGMPADGAAYTPGLPEFEALPIAKLIQERFFGTLPAQIGYCRGQNRFLNATEWHSSSEVNIAHEQNQALLDRGVKPGITGCNYEVSY